MARNAGCAVVGEEAGGALGRTHVVGDHLLCCFDNDIELLVTNDFTDGLINEIMTYQGVGATEIPVGL